jgi:hypothetical protein
MEITAEFKHPIKTQIRLDADFGEDWLKASAETEEAKRQLLFSIKDEMHKRIAEMTMEDINYTIK